MQIDFLSSASLVRSFHAHRTDFQDRNGTLGAQLRILGVPLPKIALLIVFVFLLTGGFQGKPADGASSGRVGVSARVLSVGTLSQATGQLEREWAEKVQESQFQQELASLAGPKHLELRAKEFEALSRRWNGERNVGNGVVRFEFTSPEKIGGNPLLSIEWISN